MRRGGQRATAVGSRGVTIGSGRWRGTRLVNQNPQCHPMGAREKNALFNKLAPRLAGAHVLDLFAGTGALGLEAGSRGAAQVIMVDQDKTNLVDNLDTVLNRIAQEKATEAPDLIYAPMRVETFLATQLQQAAPQTFEIILADPPYAKFAQMAPVLAQAAQLLTDDGLLVISQPAEVTPLTIAGLKLTADDIYAGARLASYVKA